MEQTPLGEQITAAMKEAMKAKDTGTLNVLRALKSALKYAAIEQVGADGELDETAALAVVRKQIKQRQDSVDSFSGAGREDLVAKEREEIAVLERYLPPALGEDEIAALAAAAVAEAGATSRKDMGTVMKIVQAKAEGRADGKALSQAVVRLLSS